MALTLALPLSGLDPENFSTLTAKLLKLAHERNLPTVERDSPSTASDSSGISSCITSNTSSVEITPNSSRPITPIRLINPKKSEENINNMNTEDNKINLKKEQEVKDIRIMYGNRNILNLGANIRPTMTWQSPPMAREKMSERNNKEEKKVKGESSSCRWSDCKFSTDKMLNKKN